MTEEKTFSYHAEIVGPDKEDNSFLVTFPDFGWGATEGSTLEEALEEAQDMLRTIIETTLNELHEPLPQKKFLSKHFMTCLPADIINRDYLQKPDYDILRWFRYKHLPDPLKETSKKFHDLAYELTDNSPLSDELLMCLRKLLEAKDAAVRVKREMIGGEPEPKPLV